MEATIQTMFTKPEQKALIYELEANPKLANQAARENAAKTEAISKI